MSRLRPHPPEDGHASATLASLLEALGGGLIEVVTAPLGLDVPVAEPVIFDPVAGLPPAPGDLLLAVGVDPGSDDALARGGAGPRERGRRHRGQARGRTPDRLVAAAESARVALLAVPPDTGWGQLFTLLRTARGPAGASPWRNGAGLAIGDLFALANAVAAMVGGATTIEDVHSNVLAFSSLDQPIDKPRQDTILGRKVPGSWLRTLDEQGVFKRLYGTGDVVRVDESATPPSTSPRGWRSPYGPAGSCWARSGWSRATGASAARPSRPCAAPPRSRRCTCCTTGPVPIWSGSGAATCFAPCSTAVGRSPASPRLG